MFLSIERVLALRKEEEEARGVTPNRDPNRDPNPSPNPSPYPSPNPSPNPSPSPSPNPNEARGVRYTWVVITRFDAVWMAPLPL